MMLSEFIERTGFEPLAFEYAKIEEAFYNFDGDKDAFCRAFVQGDGEKKVYQARAAAIDRLNGKILEMGKAAKKDDEEYEKRLAFLQAEVDWELEWRPYECARNISQAQYTELVKSIPRHSIRSWSRAFPGTVCRAGQGHPRRGCPLHDR